MKVTVKLNNLRTAPGKVRLVADLIRGKRASEAQALLSFTANKSARPILKLLNSAMATAKHDLKLPDGNLVVSEVRVDEGPKLKRWHPMSRGRAYPIMKRTSHIILTLSGTDTSDSKGKKAESKKQTNKRKATVKNKK